MLATLFIRSYCLACGWVVGAGRWVQWSGLSRLSSVRFAFNWILGPKWGPSPEIFPNVPEANGTWALALMSTVAWVKCTARWMQRIGGEW